MADPLLFPLRPENTDASTVMHTLEGLSPCRPWRTGPAALCDAADRCATAALAASGGLFVLLSALALLQDDPPMTADLWPALLQLGSIAQGVALAALLLQALGGAGRLGLPRHHALHAALRRWEHDCGNARRLGHLDDGALALAERWIEQEIRRIEARRPSFFNLADTLALGILLGAGWAVWKALVGGAALPVPGVCLVHALAWLACLVASSLVKRRAAARLGYQRDLVSMARLIHSARALVPTARRPSSG